MSSLKWSHHAPLPHIQTPTITGQTKVVINILPTLFVRNVQFMFLWIWVYPTQACEKYITRQRRYHCQKFDVSILLNIYFLSLHIYIRYKFTYCMWIQLNSSINKQTCIREFLLLTPDILILFLLQTKSNFGLFFKATNSGVTGIRNGNLSEICATTHWEIYFS